MNKLGYHGQNDDDKFIIITYLLTLTHGSISNHIAFSRRIATFFDADFNSEPSAKKKKKTYNMPYDDYIIIILIIYYFTVFENQNINYIIDPIYIVCDILRISGPGACLVVDFVGIYRSFRRNARHRAKGDGLCHGYFRIPTV